MHIKRKFHLFLYNIKNSDKNTKRKKLLHTEKILNIEMYINRIKTRTHCIVYISVRFSVCVVHKYSALP